MDIPQRYTLNSHKYQMRGGSVRIAEDIRGFVADGANTSDISRYFSFCLSFDQIVKEGVAGDIAELGVYKGQTASLLAIMARRLGRTAYLLDTFSGFNERDLTGVDAGAPTGFLDTSLDAVRALVGEENVEFIQGYFPDSAAKLPSETTYCLVHLDCDLFAPMTSALQYFYPRLAPGGFLIMHDYSSLCWEGAEKAVDEFFADKPESLVLWPDSSGSAVIRKAHAPDDRNNWLFKKRAGLICQQWTTAANGGLSPILGNGWSGPEEWGVWGVDEVHEMFVYMSAKPEGDIELEFDVNALIFGECRYQEIEVSAAGLPLEIWIFTTEQNRSIRRLLIPKMCCHALGNALPKIVLEFRPRLVTSAAILDPGNSDTRRLGLALHCIRRIA